MKSIFICAIGPVQDFIATARRSRDLWYGSWMLSELSRSVARQIEAIYPNSLIFPNPDVLKSDENLNVPNKVVAIVSGNPRELGNQLEETVYARIKALWQNARSQTSGDIDAELAEAQVLALPEVYWVSVPLPDETQYPEARDRAEALLAARKVTRDFTQVLGRDVPKSSLDGARESVIPQEAYPARGDSDREKQSKNIHLYWNYRARPGEQLSGVDLLKRLGEPDSAPKFKSTTHMAALPFFEHIGPDKKAQLLDALKSLVEQEVRKITRKPEWQLDEQEAEYLVFVNRATDWFSSAALAAQVQEKHARIFEKVLGKDGPRPSPYYALLAADGDNMGVVIDAQKDPAAHREFSLALSGFARQAPQIVSNCLGVPIYSGGDDVLAYLPLHRALEYVEQLEKAFREQMQAFKGQKGGEIFSPTLSTGLVIAHYLEPLSDVLELARQAEREAKSVPGKNGLAITLSKRGGADRTARGKMQDLYPRLCQLIEFTRAQSISARAAYELQELHRALGEAGVTGDGLAKETLKIIARKREARSSTPVSAEVKNAFIRWLDPSQVAVPLDELATEMIIARIFAGQPAIEPTEEFL